MESRENKRAGARESGQVFAVSCVLPNGQELWCLPVQLVLFDTGATGLATWACRAEGKLSLGGTML